MTIQPAPRVLGLLGLLVVVRLLFHALAVPAFEGHDEMFHLARVLAFRDLGVHALLRDDRTDPAVIGSLRTRPCNENLHRLYGCPSFGSEKARFNVLEPRAPAGPGDSVRNIENNQPPLFYAAVGLPLCALTHTGRAFWMWPETGLLVSRLASVVFVAIALLIPGRRLAREMPGAAAAGLLALLLPGASEALARCANDALAFLFGAFVVEAVASRRSAWGVASAAGLGLFTKLTALPVAAFAVVALWSERRRLGAFAAFFAACLVLPFQALRGYRWGGTYEMNRPWRGFEETALETVVGFGRSVYTFAKTTFWLGNWSFFRPPAWLLVAFWGVLLLLLLSLAPRRDARRSLAHAVCAAVALAGVLLFAFAHRRFWGVWGGVGGWYFWSWLPWIVLAADNLVEVRPAARRAAFPVALAFVIAANVAYLRKMDREYGVEGEPAAAISVRAAPKTCAWAEPSPLGCPASPPRARSRAGSPRRTRSRSG